MLIFNEKVKMLIDATGATVFDYNDAEKHGVPMNFYSWMSNGFYEPRIDKIGINPNPVWGMGNVQTEIDYVVLHELIHWTGKSKRLARPAVVVTENAATCHLFTSEYKDTEEVTAQLGMYKLGVILGFDKDVLKKLLIPYYENHIEADLNKVDRDSDKAVAYLLNLIGINMVTA